MNTARLVIGKVIHDDVKEIVKLTNEIRVNEAKKTVEKNQSRLIKDAKINLAKSFNDTDKTVKKPRKPTNKKPVIGKDHKPSSEEKEVPTDTPIHFELIAPPTDVAPDVSVAIEHDGILPQTEVIKYEIEPKRNGPFCDECMIITTRKVGKEGEEEEGKEDEEDIIINITNHQKEFGKEGEFLMMLESGYRIWATATLTHKDCKVFKVEELLFTYMTENKLTFEMMGYVEKVKKQKKLFESTSNIPTLIPCDSLHNKFICFGEETNACYANINQFYYGVKCRGGCNRYFSNKPTKSICEGM